jgi:hypothetical protein
VTGSRSITVLTDIPDRVSPPMISRPLAVGNRTSRETAAGSWYGAGMIWSVIAAPGSGGRAGAFLAGASGREPVHAEK